MNLFVIKFSLVAELFCPFTLSSFVNRDIPIRPAAVANSHRFMKGPYEYLEIDDGHWLVQTQYGNVREALLKHLKKFTA